MAEMSLERACEVMNEWAYLSSQWAIRVGPTGRRTLQGDDGYAGFAMPEHTAIAVAEKLLRDAAPPAERAGGRPEGQLSGDSGQLGEAVEILGRLARRLADDQPIGVYNGLGGKVAMTAGALRALLAAAERRAGAEKAYMALNNEIEQTLGKALGYPKLYPHASKVDDGAVGVGDHTAASLADEAAERIAKLQASLAERSAGAEAGPSLEVRDLAHAAEILNADGYMNRVDWRVDDSGAVVSDDGPRWALDEDEAWGLAESTIDDHRRFHEAIMEPPR